ncbi:unnamed protein product, partial [Bubo scandiacus]
LLKPNLLVSFQCAVSLPRLYACTKLYLVRLYAHRHLQPNRSNLLDKFTCMVVLHRKLCYSLDTLLSVKDILFVGKRMRSVKRCFLMNKISRICKMCSTEAGA